MSAINPTAKTASSTSATGSASSTARAGDILSKDAFLKIMMAQLKNQDPLSTQSQDPTQFVNELSQMTTLEQTTNIATYTSQQASEAHTVATLAMLGHTVTYIDPSGNSVTGAVDKVQFTSSGPTLTVAGISGVDPTSVNEVS